MLESRLGGVRVGQEEREGSMASSGDEDNSPKASVLDGIESSGIFLGWLSEDESLLENVARALKGRVDGLLRSCCACRKRCPVYIVKKVDNHYHE
jgi:hypothetical protein